MSEIKQALERVDQGLPLQQGDLTLRNLLRDARTLAAAYRDLEAENERLRFALAAALNRVVELREGM